MKPRMREGEFVFCTISEEERARVSVRPVSEFEEDEGITLILRRSDAIEQNIPAHFPCRMITLTVHSSLDAVGFLAAVCTTLAARGISVNAVSAFFHDHLFVPSARAEEALVVLRELAQSSGASGTPPDSVERGPQ